MRHSFLCFFFLTLSVVCLGQANPIYKSIDTKALAIPDSSTKSIEGLANYFNVTFTTPKEKVRAVYIWLAKNIQYDVANMFVIDFYEKKEEKIKKILSARKGICSGYSYVFTDVCSKMNIRAYTVIGYTTYGGVEHYVPHAWAAAKIDSSWCMFDPTWGAGYAEDGKFIAEVNEDWFMQPPASFVESHMPFDPMWQFLNTPVTNEEFKSGISMRAAPDRYFDYEDSIARYEKMNDIDKSITASSRVEKNGVTNSLVFDRLAHYKIEIEHYKNKRTTDLYNKATANVNESINDYNRFVNYRNHNFTPKKSESEIRRMISVPETKIKEAENLLKEITEPSENITSLMEALKGSIDNLSSQIREQKVFLNQYFKKK